MFDKIKDKYNLIDNKKNECGFYHINDSLEIVVDDKTKFNM